MSCDPIKASIESCLLRMILNLALFPPHLSSFMMAEPIAKSDKTHVKPRVERGKKKSSGVKALEIPAKYSRQNPDMFQKLHEANICFYFSCPVSLSLIRKLDFSSMNYLFQTLSPCSLNGASLSRSNLVANVCIFNLFILGICRVNISKWIKECFFI